MPAIRRRAGAEAPAVGDPAAVRRIRACGYDREVSQSPRCPVNASDASSTYRIKVVCALAHNPAVPDRIGVVAGLRVAGK